MSDLKLRRRKKKKNGTIPTKRKSSDPIKVEWSPMVSVCVIDEMTTIVAQKQNPKIGKTPFYVLNGSRPIKIH